MINEKALIEHCSPTLSSIKTANLFTVKFVHLNDLHNDIAFWNDKFSESGVQIKLLKTGAQSALIYIYRENMLETDIENARAKAILSQYGYDDLSVAQALQRLSHRLSTYEEFPHEIGLFLGYPPEDVEGFICNKGQNCNLCGYWKVYGDTNDAMARFARYDRCRMIYKQLWEQGRDILRLTVKKAA